MARAHLKVAKTKAFNTRFRAKHFSGDASVTAPERHPSDPIDARGSPAFIELDNALALFRRENFPQHLRAPIIDNVVDNHLYTAFLLPLVWVSS